jgi:hypothetical protein
VATTSDSHRILTSFVALGLLGTLASGWAGEFPVAGVTPDQRPAGAPVITAVDKDAGWYTQALTGVEPPYPASLRFLEDQGNWFTPFSHPGMTGRYDLRKWYR